MLHLEPSLKDKVLPSMYLTITGGGTGLIPKLLESGGASSYFFGAEVPYNDEITRNILSSLDDNAYDLKLVSKEVAVILAQHSAFEAKLGIGVTCSLMKAEGERPDRKNEAFACFNLAGKLYEYHWEIAKEDDAGMYVVKKTRWMQERVLVNALYETLVEILSE